MIKVTIDLEYLASELIKNNKKYITIQEISRRLSVSERTAGKILSRLEKLGYAKRYSTRTYELLPILGPVAGKRKVYFYND